MGGSQPDLSGPDFRSGVALDQLQEGVATLGHVDGEAIIVVRRGGELFAVGATCTHYGGPLAEGVIDGDTVRCPWHHACFSLRTGEAVAAPAIREVACYAVEQRGDRVHVLSKKALAAPAAPPPHPAAVVIVGGGAAGYAAAEMLRRRGYAGKLTILSADDAPPVDRPNLSKDYLAGTAPEDWIPMAGPEFFAEHHIDLRLKTRVSAINVREKTVVTGDGQAIAYDALLLATGAEPITLQTPGADLPHVHTLRSLSDCRAIIGAVKGDSRVVVVGASFIGLEVAAALRARNVEVHVVAPDALPLQKILGAQIGQFVRDLHQEHGVVFHLRDTVRSIQPRSVILTSGTSLAADLVVVGIGVRPRVTLAETAGLTVDGGVVVDQHLQTSAGGVFAAGDIARWPDPHSGQLIRVEHWVVAERQGQIAAENILGMKVPCAVVPFFWSQHYDVAISYVGHATHWDRADVEGSVADKNCVVALRSADKTLAVITIGRDRDSLQAELAFQRGDTRALAAIARPPR